MELPVEKRALGLAMRKAERDGIIVPPAELRDLVAGLPYAPRDVDSCLDLLVSKNGRTIGRTLDLDALPEQWKHDLAGAALAEQTDDGVWLLTQKGKLFERLLSEYADPRHVWKSMLYRRR